MESEVDAVHSSSSIKATVSRVPSVSLRQLAHRQLSQHILRVDSNSYALQKKQEEMAHPPTNLSPHGEVTPVVVPKSKKKPNLFVRIATEMMEKEDLKKSTPPGKTVHENNEGKEDKTVVASKSSGSSVLPTPVMQISPRGTFLLGDLCIREDGITPGAGRDSALLSQVPVMRGMDFIEIGALGSGASGVVVEAVHVPTLTIVALKTLPVYSEEKCQSLARELTVLYKNLEALSLVDESLQKDNPFGAPTPTSHPIASNKCPNLLSLYNAFVNVKNGTVNLVMEYMDGGSLEDLVRNGGCQDESVLSDIARQTLTGLQFLHSNNSVHRDIKPANILCSSNGVIKIADFGISKVMDNAQSFAKSFVGTVIYMSPERITGGAYDFSSDIWSFGLTLLAVANGSFPLHSIDNPSKPLPEDRVAGGGNNGAAQWGGNGGYWGMIEAVCDNEPPTPGAEFSKEFSSFIQCCLRKSPQERSSANDLLQHTFITQYMDVNNDSVAVGDGNTSPNFVAPPMSARGNGDSSALAASLNINIAKRSAKSRATDSADSEVSKLSPSTTTDLSVDENGGRRELSEIDKVHVRHLEHIVNKLIYRDRFDSEVSNHDLNNTNGEVSTGHASNRRLRNRMDSTDQMADEAAYDIDDVDDLFMRINSVRNGARTPGTSRGGKKPFTPRYKASGTQHNRAIIDSILMMQGDYPEPVEDDPNVPVPLVVHAPMPRLTGPDLQKWQNLASQLHLPLDIVIQLTENALEEAKALLREELEEEEARSKLRHDDASTPGELSPRSDQATVGEHAPSSPPYVRYIPINKSSKRELDCSPSVRQKLMEDDDEGPADNQGILNSKPFTSSSEQSSGSEKKHQSSSSTTATTATPDKSTSTVLPLLDVNRAAGAAIQRNVSGVIWRRSSDNQLNSAPAIESDDLTPDNHINCATFSTRFFSCVSELTKKYY